MNVSSIVVLTAPQYTDGVVEDLKNCGLCDYHLHDELGRIIITIEGKDVKEEMDKLRIIETMPHVIAANMQMSYTEDELESQRESLQMSAAIPEVLAREDIKLEDIVYNGDLKKKM